jgi:hypothetical protein
MAMLTEADQFYGANYTPNQALSGGFDESAFFGEGASSGLPQSRPSFIPELGGVGGPDPQFTSIDDLIQQRTPEALGILNEGSEEQLRFARLGTEAGLAPLREVDDLRAFEEQQAILGQRGAEAQEFAIGNIPESEFDTELRRRQQQQLMRGAAASGEAGGGATLQAGQQLAGAQQANFIQQRLAQLSPLVAASRGIRSTMSGLSEQGRVGEAQIQSGLGTQLANVRLGATAPQIESIQRGAELSGLQGISSANQQASRNNQLASLAGTLSRIDY